MTDKFDRYFIAVVPPEPILSEAQELKNYFKNQYNSKASLNSPPHITLHMPFRWKEKKEKLLVEKLSAFAQTKTEFDIELQNFGAFSPRVIYMNIGFDTNLLTLQKELERFCKRELQLFNANRLDQAFYPHLTLAFRDLKKEMFAKAWQEFEHKEYQKSFSCKALSLLKQEGKIWKCINIIDLRASLKTKNSLPDLFRHPLINSLNGDRGTSPRRERRFLEMPLNDKP